MEEVLDARIAPGGRILSASRKIVLLHGRVLDDGLDHQSAVDDPVDRLDTREHLGRIRASLLRELRRGSSPCLQPARDRAGNGVMERDAASGARRPPARSRRPSGQRRRPGRAQSPWREANVCPHARTRHQRGVGIGDRGLADDARPPLASRLCRRAERPTGRGVARQGSPPAPPVEDGPLRRGGGLRPLSVSQRARRQRSTGIDVSDAVVEAAGEPIPGARGCAGGRPAPAVPGRVLRCVVSCSTLDHFDSPPSSRSDSASSRACSRRVDGCCDARQRVQPARLPPERDSLALAAVMRLVPCYVGETSAGRARARLARSGLGVVRNATLMHVPRVAVLGLGAVSSCGPRTSARCSRPSGSATAVRDEVTAQFIAALAVKRA